MATVQDDTDPRPEAPPEAPQKLAEKPPEVDPAIAQQMRDLIFSQRFDWSSMAASWRPPDGPMSPDDRLRALARIEAWCASARKRHLDDDFAVGLDKDLRAIHRVIDRVRDAYSKTDLRNLVIARLLEQVEIDRELQRLAPKLLLEPSAPAAGGLYPADKKAAANKPDKDPDEDLVHALIVFARDLATGLGERLLAREGDVHRAVTLVQSDRRRAISLMCDVLDDRDAKHTAHTRRDDERHFDDWFRRWDRDRPPKKRRTQGG